GHPPAHARLSRRHRATKPPGRGHRARPHLDRQLHPRQPRPGGRAAAELRSEAAHCRRRRRSHETPAPTLPPALESSPSRVKIFAEKAVRASARPRPETMNAKLPEETSATKQILYGVSLLIGINDEAFALLASMA